MTPRPTIIHLALLWAWAAIRTGAPPEPRPAMPSNVGSDATELSAPLPASHGPAGTESDVQGTVQSVAADGSWLQLVTGVGYALRVVRIQIASSTTLDTSRAGLAQGDWRCGDIVRSHCRRRVDQLVADRIERVRTP